jgi:hypothetical protein
MHGLDEVEFVPGVYGEAPIDVTDRHVIMVDFSYKRPILEEMIQAAKSVLILDHHKTAQADLARLVPEGASTEEVRHEWKQIRSNPNPVKKVITGIFDMDRSGAQIAWDFFCPLAERPALVDYVGDRDLWRFDLERSQDISAYIFSHDYGFKAWSRLAEDLEECFVDCANEGEAITRKHWKDIRELLTVTRRDMVIGGHRVPVANLPYTMASDAAGFMAESAPFDDDSNGLVVGARLPGRCLGVVRVEAGVPLPVRRVARGRCCVHCGFPRRWSQPWKRRPRRIVRPSQKVPSVRNFRLKWRKSARRCAA